MLYFVREMFLCHDTSKNATSFINVVTQHVISCSLLPGWFSPSPRWPPIRRCWQIGGTGPSLLLRRRRAQKLPEHRSHCSTSNPSSTPPSHSPSTKELRPRPHRHRHSGKNLFKKQIVSSLQNISSWLTSLTDSFETRNRLREEWYKHFFDFKASSWILQYFVLDTMIDRQSETVFSSDIIFTSQMINVTKYCVIISHKIRSQKSVKYTTKICLWI